MTALPTEQHGYDDLPALPERVIQERRERVFLVFAGIFLGTLAMLNIIGITRFVDLSFSIPLTDLRVPMVVAIGVLPYPITFLCTDFISELYGRKRASFMVLVGLVLNVWVVFILWLGGILPGYESPVFDELRTLAFGAVTASMVAYMAAQLVDVHVFHFWKTLTRGRHLWLRNNGSTLVSQLVDTTAVILITHYYAGGLTLDPNAPVSSQLFTYIAAGYAFKLLVALVDTIPFYIGSRQLARYLRLPPPGAQPSEGRQATAELSAGEP
jgi:queuosine precursor transporter